MAELRGADAIRAAAETNLASLGPFATVFLYNNADYISFLESGSSAQAPNGMVAVSVAEVENLGL